MELYENKLTMKAWAEEDRPREKLMLKGREALSDAELIAILIGSGNARETAVDLSRRILESAGKDLNALGRMSLTDLLKFKGIGEAKALSILAALELGRRRKAGIAEKNIVRTSADAAAIFQPMLGDMLHEEFWILLLNNAHVLLGTKKISAGGMTGTVADSRMIFRSALESNAVSIVLCHNHPSGNQQPSEADIRLTRRLVQAGDAIEVKVLDHIIVTQNGYHSFADSGML